MINPKPLLNDLKRLVKQLEDDLRERAANMAEMADRLQAEYRSAKEASRTGESFEVWREGVLTQAAVAWILGGVFVRFMEDNGLVDEPLISGAGEKRSRAADRQTLYFQAHPTDTDRDYLYDVFRTVAGLPAVAKLYDEAHNPLWAYGVSGDAAKELIGFWRRIVPETGELVHDFTDTEWNTRFLGDLYQDLSEAVRKRYALLQTPEFVEEFILDRTLDPVIEAFGLGEVRLIDPTCGSGHFLLGAFRRLLDRWFKQAPGTAERELVQRTLDGVYGVDINPYAVAIARFRLLVEALKASGIRRMKEAPGYRINVTAGDSLLHGRWFDELDLGSGADQLGGISGIGHAFQAEDLAELNRILGQPYHAVVGNPPYITVKDKALNQLYRGRYRTCHRQYALAVPFTERFFQLAVFAGSAEAGYVGMITANSFMKREFGKKLVEEFFPGVDLTHVIDTSGAYIPGHGTPTVILFGRDRAPVAPTVRTVMGIKGEPATPEEASKGVVWSAIVEQIDRAGSESEWVSVADTARESFGRHPWSVGGGGAANLRESLDDVASETLGSHGADIGFLVITGEDNCLLLPPDVPSRCSVYNVVAIGHGEAVRDIESDRYIGLIERPEHKRRWNLEPWEEQEKRALRGWLLDRLEQCGYWPEPHLQSVRSLAAGAETDPDFMQVADLYVGHPGFDVAALVAERVASESVPFLPVLRYKPTGLRKRETWEKIWQLQRREDAIDAQVAAELTRIGGETDEDYQSRVESEQRKRKKAEIGDIASPPKYRSADFVTNGYWRLRGALDVPKERFVSYPHCSRENDPSLVVGWAGWDQLQQAQALAGYYTEMVEQEGWQVERLKPLLAGLGELLPWLKQWHNDIDPRV